MSGTIRQKRSMRSAKFFTPILQVFFALSVFSLFIALCIVVLHYNSHKIDFEVIVRLRMSSLTRIENAIGLRDATFGTRLNNAGVVHNGWIENTQLFGLLEFMLLGLAACVVYTRRKDNPDTPWTRRI
jgi:hypothetical protein